jgi:hypothetical protein
VWPGTVAVAATAVSAVVWVAVVVGSETAAATENATACKHFVWRHRNYK